MREGSGNSRHAGHDDSGLGVVVADDDATVRSALADVLNDDPRFVVRGAVANGDDLLDLLAALGKPATAGAGEIEGDGFDLVLSAAPVRVVLLDVRMAGSGPEIVRRLTAEHPDLTIVAVSASTEKGTVLGMLHAGVHGYLAKGSIGADLADYVAACLTGRRVIVVPNPDLVHDQLSREDSQRPGC